MRTLLLLLLLSLLCLTCTPVWAQTTILYTANSFGEYMPCPS